MENSPIRAAEVRLAEAIARLNRVRHVTRLRYLAGKSDERDLKILMEADAEVERVVAWAEKLKNASVS